MTTLDLPTPPSANNLYPGRARRFKSPAYKAWLVDAGLALNLQRPDRVAGPYALVLRLPAAMRGDVSNRIKAVEDLLVKHGVTPDDRHCVSSTALRCPDVAKGRCLVVVEERNP